VTPCPWWVLLALIGFSGAVLAAAAYDMRRRLPRQVTARRLIADAEQACWDAAFDNITNRMEQP
jgi:hypothetical protein